MTITARVTEGRSIEISWRHLHYSDRLSCVCSISCLTAMTLPHARRLVFSINRRRPYGTGNKTRNNLVEKTWNFSTHAVLALCAVMFFIEHGNSAFALSRRLGLANRIFDWYVMCVMSKLPMIKPEVHRWALAIYHYPLGWLVPEHTCCSWPSHFRFRVMVCCFAYYCSNSKLNPNIASKQTERRKFDII